jgi:hypothetical protein
MKKSFTIIFLFFMFLAPVIAQKSEKTVSTVVTQESGVTIYLKGKLLIVQNATIGEKLNVLSIVGVRVYEKRVDSTYMEIPLELPKGYYIVKVGTVVRKIAIK